MITRRVIINFFSSKSKSFVHVQVNIQIKNVIVRPWNSHSERSSSPTWWRTSDKIPTYRRMNYSSTFLMFYVKNHFYPLSASLWSDHRADSGTLIFLTEFKYSTVKHSFVRKIVCLSSKRYWWRSWWQRMWVTMSLKSFRCRLVHCKGMLMTSLMTTDVSDDVAQELLMLFDS